MARLNPGALKAVATGAAKNGTSKREREAIFGWSGDRTATLDTKSAIRAGLRRRPSAS